jgi:hypothetical protein
MSDLISRQAAIDAVEESRRLNHHTDRKAARDHENEHRHFLNILNGLPPADRWILCSEKLPEEETDVLVTRTFLGCKDSSHGWNAHIPPKTYVEVAQYSNGEWTALSDEYKVARRRHTDPFAWMPMPEPYKEDEQG